MMNFESLLFFNGSFDLPSFNWIFILLYYWHMLQASDEIRSYIIISIRLTFPYEIRSYIIISIRLTFLFTTNSSHPS